MFSDVLILDNIFDDPFYIKNEMNNFLYYPSNNEKSLIGIKIDKNTKNKPLGSWFGYRSNPIQDENPELFVSIYNSIFQKIFFDKKYSSLNYNINSYFHVIDSSFKKNKE